MITQFKIFEQIKEEPQIGDYVVVSFENSSIKDLEYRYHGYDIIGRIFYIQRNALYEIEFLEDNENPDYWWFGREDIEAYSKNKKDLEIYIDTNKYNI